MLADPQPGQRDFQAADEAAHRAAVQSRQEGHVPDRFGPRNTPERIRWLTGLSLITLLALLVVTWVYIGQARDGLAVIGHGEGPRVVATADLYYALADMDAQVANVVLIDSTDADLGITRDEVLETYEERRSDANRALLHAGQLALGDAEAEETVREVLDGLGRYEQLAGEVVLVSEQSGDAQPPLGAAEPEPSDDAAELYREATDLMTEELLPKAYNVTLESGSIVRATYDESSSALTMGQILVGAAGVAAVGALALLQLYLRARFRRRFSPTVASALALALILVLAALNLLGSEAEHLRAAKEDGFDAGLAMAQARAISTSAQGDQSRYLLDPERADTFEQVYLERSQTVLYVPGGSVAEYNEASDVMISEHIDEDYDEALFSEITEDYDDGMLGLLGEETQDGGLNGDQADSLGEVLAAYRDLQASDAAMRELAAEDSLAEAVEVRLGDSEDSVASAQARYDAALTDLSSVHRDAFDSAVSDGESQLANWNWLLPAAVIAIAILVIVGVRPRIAEYNMS